MKIINIILLSCLTVTSNAQWQWAKRIGSNYDVAASPFFTDNSNNIYVSGNYQYNCYFQTATLTSSGYTDMFIAKYDQSGNEIWIKNFGGNNPINSDERLRTYVDKTGNFIIAVGTFYDTLSIDGNSVSSFGGPDIFIAKFDLNGNCIWIKHGGGLGNDFGYVFTLDANNDIFLTGSNTDTATFDSFVIPPGKLFAKYDLNGTCLFAKKKYSGLAITDISPIGIDLILAGYLSDSTIVLDTIVRNPTRSSAILGKIDAIGNALWLKLYSGNNVAGTSISLDAQNNIYYTGNFEDSITFSGTTIYHSPGSTLSDFYLSKLDSNGNAQWVRQSHTSGFAHGYAVSADDVGNVYLSGDFSGNAQFESINDSAGTNSDFFITRYSSTGDCLGLRHFGVAISMNNIVTDNNGSVIVGGQFINTILVGSQNLSSTNAINPDVFIAKADEITGIEGEGRLENNQLIIYANPNEGKCNISIPEDFNNDKKLVLSIFDRQGKLMQQSPVKINEDLIKIDLQAEAKGTYLVNLSNGVKTYSGKIVFE